MPTYQYACTACGHQLEAVQSFSDAALTECPECAGRLRKVFSAVGIVFKGSGFYRTDSRPGSAPSEAASSTAASSTGDTGSPASSSSGSQATPAAAPSTASSESSSASTPSKPTKATKSGKASSTATKAS